MKIIPACARKSLISIAMCLGLAACSSQAQLSVNYYILDHELAAYQQSSSTAKHNPDKQIVLSQVRLAKYLEQSQLTILQNNHQLYYTSQHVWSEQLKHAIARALVNDFNTASNDYHLVLKNEPTSHDSRYQLQLQLDHLVATDDSEVILAGKFWLLDHQKNKKGELVASSPFYFSKDLSENGFSHSVKQQRQLLKQLANRISSVLTER